MQRPQLEHLIRAAAGITGATEIVVIGRQAVLGQFPDAPDDLLVSIEAGVFTFGTRGKQSLALDQPTNRRNGTNSPAH